MHKISNFHYITQFVEGFSHAELAELACKGGVNWVQLRVKNKSYSEWLEIAKETKLVCEKHKAKLIINDSVEIALAVNADGVHLGKEDLRPMEAREKLGSLFIIGGTANSLEDIVRLTNEGVDYIGLGPFRLTSTKEKLSPVLGIEKIKEIITHYKTNISNPVPIIVIGGIVVDDIESILLAEAYGIAVSSAVNLVNDKTDAARKINNAVNRKQ